ncbi:MAG: hypothetical protein JSR47_00345 [Proteobacteria bacterium]|nr:hypothetical protein [Pseudomonadota bacterium]
MFRTFNEGEEVVKPSGKTEARQWPSTLRTASRGASDPELADARKFALQVIQFLQR